MKKIFLTVFAAVMGAAVGAYAEETPKPAPAPKTTQPVQTKTVRPDESSSTLMMKISEDETPDELRKRAIIDELRKLYKANFL